MALLDRLKGRWSTHERRGLAAVALGGCLALSLCWLFPTKLAETYRYVEARQALYRLVQYEHIENAVIFIRAVGGGYLPWNLTRNRPDFQGTVLYVHDLGTLNHLLMRQYPGRTFFLYDYDETKEPILRHLVLDDAGG
jgi:hypothetical protein